MRLEEHGLLTDGLFLTCSTRMVDFIYYSVNLSQIELPQQSDIISYIPDKVET